MSHFRILIPSVKLRGYARRFENTRPKTAFTDRKVLENIAAELLLGPVGIQSRSGKCYNFVTTPRWSDRGLPGSNRLDQMVLRVTERERATILAALRRWLSYPAARGADLTATNRGKHKPLDDGEIQRLCQRLSETAKRGHAAPLRRHSSNGADMQKHRKRRDD